ncbi:hypothetical protein ILYODFUR_024699 [Ilyodon furcidens]|uniref:Uncharacterized protein n=1 Tax=Ilyodon furcidens TaxID=33524 RepID=A0ABV0TQI5_9TELE
MMSFTNSEPKSISVISINCSFSAAGARTHTHNRCPITTSKSLPRRLLGWQRDPTLALHHPFLVQALELNDQQSAAHTQAFANQRAGSITEPVHQDETVFFFCLNSGKTASLTLSKQHNNM